MMIVWVLETPKSCIILAEPIPGTGLLTILLGSWVLFLRARSYVEETIE